MDVSSQRLAHVLHRHLLAALGKVDDILSTANYGIYRQRHANTATAPRAAVPRGPLTTP